MNMSDLYNQAQVAGAPANGAAKSYDREKLQFLNLGGGFGTQLMAINPRTGQAEAVLEDYGPNWATADPLQSSPIGYYFPSDGAAPSTASQAYAGGYGTDNGSTLDNFLERAVQGGLAAIGGAGALSAVGGAGMTAVDAATLGDMTGGTAASSAAGGTASGTAGGAVATGGVTGLPMAAAPAPAAMPVAAGADIGGGLTLDAAGNVTGGAMGLSGAPSAAAGGTGLGAVGSAAGAAGAAGAGQSPVSSLTGLDPSMVQLLGILGASGFGAYGQNEQSNRLKAIYDDMTARREPFRAKSLEYLNDPAAYAAGPGATTMDAVLRRLSVGGNPVSDPAKLDIATKAGLSDWRNAVTGFGNMGLAGEDTRAGVATNQAQTAENVYGNIGAGLGAVTRPRRTMNDIYGSLI